MQPAIPSSRPLKLQQHSRSRCDARDISNKNRLQGLNRRAWLSYVGGDGTPIEEHSMRFIKATPIIAILALAACGDDQTAQTETAPPPATETPAAPVTGEATQADTDVQAASPTTPDTDATAAAPADTAPAAAIDSPTGLPQTTLAPPPTPSSSFGGADSMAPPEVGAAGAVLADAPFDAGTYSVGDLTLELSETGNFTLTRGDSGETVSGDFRVYGDMMTFSNVGADVPPGMFPMTCRIQPADGGFSLTADGPSCDLLDGQTFVRG
jgi:hypothetical protein